jgi:hypothetical protein
MPIAWLQAYNPILIIHFGLRIKVQDPAFATTRTATNLLNSNEPVTSMLLQAMVLSDVMDMATFTIQTG